MKLKNLFVLLIVGIVFISSCGKKKKGEMDKTAVIGLYDSEFIKEEYGIWLYESMLCENVIDRKPVNPASEFKTATNVKVYVFTRVGCRDAGQTIYHRYSIKRESLDEEKELWEQVHITELYVKSTGYRTWSYKTTYPGRWRVDILAPDKKSIIKSYIFDVIDPGKDKSYLNVNPDYDMSQLKLIDSTLCESIEDNEPIEPVEEYILSEGEKNIKVLVWMKFECEDVPARAFLRWSREIKSVTGEKGWSPEVIYDLDIKGKKWRTQGAKTCTKGNWRLDILGTDGKTILKTFTFEVKSSEPDDQADV